MAAARARSTGAIESFMSLCSVSLAHAPDRPERFGIASAVLAGKAATLPHLNSVLEISNIISLGKLMFLSGLELT